MFKKNELLKMMQDEPVEVYDELYSDILSKYISVSYSVKIINPEEAFNSLPLQAKERIINQKNIDDALAYMKFEISQSLQEVEGLSLLV